MTKRFAARALAAGVISFGMATLAASPAAAQAGRPGAGAVFVGTNHNNTADADEPPNQVAMYRRAPDGRLSLLGYFNTGGQGSGPSRRFAGDGLGSAHSVRLTQNGRFLLVTNAGSDSVSVFRVMRNRLVLTDVEPTGDGSAGFRFQNSVTQSGNLVYVLNSSDEGSIVGFRLSSRGTLTPLAGSARPLAANQGAVQAHPPDTLFNPTQVQFTPDGRQLVVTIKDGPVAGAPIPNFTVPTGPGRVLVFGVGRDGRPSATFTQTNLNNLGPFGFSFDRRGNLLVALFVGGPELTASAGSFRINRDGTLTPITGDVDNGQLDSCWIENNGRYAWTANYTSGTVSTYRIGADGSLTLVDAEAGITDDLPGPPGKSQGSTPLDLGVSRDGRYLYNVLPGSGAVVGWRINSDGSLTKLGEFPGLPDTVNGDMAPEERFGPGGSPAGIDVL